MNGNKTPDVSATVNRHLFAKQFTVTTLQGDYM